MYVRGRTRNIQPTTVWRETLGVQSALCMMVAQNMIQDEEEKAVDFVLTTSVDPFKTATLTGNTRDYRHY